MNFENIFLIKDNMNYYGNLYIKDTNFTDLSGFININRVIGTIIIENNKYLSNINGLSNITYMESLIINNNEFLYDMDFHKVTFIEGDVTITNNDRLNNLDGLSNLKYIGGNYNGCSYNQAAYYKYGSLVIKHNKNLSDINGLSNVHTINGNLIINTNLKDVCVFKNLKCVHYGIDVKNNNREFQNINNLINCDENSLIVIGYCFILVLLLLFCSFYCCCLVYHHNNEEKLTEDNKTPFII